MMAKAQHPDLQTENSEIRTNLRQLSEEVCSDFNDNITQVDLWLKGKHPALTDEEKSTYSTQQSNNLRMRALVYEKLDRSSAKFIKEWFSAKRSEDCDNFVISVGSYGSIEQQKPNFANNPKTAILNIDPSFKPEEFISSSKETITKMKAPFRISMPQSYDAIKSEISTTFSNGNKVIIMDFKCPFGFKDFLGITSEFKENLGNNLAYIQGYFSFYPVAVLNNVFFEANIETQEAFLRKEILSGRYSKCNLEPITEEKISALETAFETINNNPEHNQYGKFYTGLERIESIEDIFSKEIPKNPLLVNKAAKTSFTERFSGLRIRKETLGVPSENPTAIPTSAPTVAPIANQGFVNYVQNPEPNRFPTLAPTMYHR